MPRTNSPQCEEDLRVDENVESEVAPAQPPGRLPAGLGKCLRDLVLRHADELANSERDGGRWELRRRADSVSGLHLSFRRRRWSCHSRWLTIIRRPNHFRKSSMDCFMSLLAKERAAILIWSPTTARGNLRPIDVSYGASRASNTPCRTRQEADPAGLCTPTASTVEARRTSVKGVVA